MKRVLWAFLFTLFSFFPKTIEASEDVCVPDELQALDPDMSDGRAIQTCLDRRGQVELEPRVYVTDRGLRMRSDTALSSRSSVKAIIRADNTLGSQPILAITGTNFVIESIIFDGNKYERIGKLCQSEDRRSNNLQVGGEDFVVRDVESYNAVCGTGLGVIVGIRAKIYNVRSAYNGFSMDEEPHKPYQFSDGMTVQYCEDCEIHDNLLVDNSDFDFLFGGGPRNLVHHNTVIHKSVFGFGGLNIGKMDTGRWRDETRKWDGDHEGSVFYLNTVESELGMLMFGISQGSHPFTPSFNELTLVDGGSLVYNTSIGSQIPLLIEGVQRGVIMGNRTKDARGNRTIFNSCGLSANYVVGHVNFSPQAGFVRKTIDNGICGK